MRKFYRFMIEFWWKVEHLDSEKIACIGFVRRKMWENKYVARFNENIYGQPL